MTITGLREHSTAHLAGVFVFTDFARLMDFNYYAHIEEIAPRSMLFIVRTVAATKFMSKAGFHKAAQPKEWFEIPGRHIVASMTTKLE